jgi:tyrosinase
MKALSTKSNPQWFRREIGAAELFNSNPAVVPPLEALPAGVRPDERNYPQAQREAYIAAIQSLVASGAYSNFVNIHVDMSHDMHGRMFMDDGSSHVSPTGIQRFLSWHRAYLLEFEKLLQAHTPGLRIPYWRWSMAGASFPDWLVGVMPAGLSNAAGDSYDVTREVGVADTLPTADSIRSILDLTPYTVFTLALEGWTPYGAHNQVHVYVGGTMGTGYSPADPVFWLHHAEIDRLWHIWQLAHSGHSPTLSGNKRIMDPWAYRPEDLQSIASLGYSYESTEV